MFGWDIEDVQIFVLGPLACGEVSKYFAELRLH